MAKSAVFSALQLLLKKAGLNYQDLHSVFLSGGFGNFINLEKAIGVGLFPTVFLSKIEVIGNSSLKGCISYIDNGTTEKDFSFSPQITEVILSNEKDFNTYYYENMDFPSDK